MNIALIGFRGTGKTTICRLLARSMDKKLISAEEEFEKKTKLGMDKYVKKHGWEKFREAETEIIEALSDHDDCIFDTNSSILMRNENMTNLKKNSLTIFLTADAKSIMERIKSNKELSNFERTNMMEEIKKFLDKYEEKHRKSADYIIDTSKLTPQEAHDLIMHYATMELQ